jgi:signal peptidase I
MASIRPMATHDSRRRDGSRDSLTGESATTRQPVGAYIPRSDLTVGHGTGVRISALVAYALTCSLVTWLVAQTNWGKPTLVGIGLAMATIASTGYAIAVWLMPVVVIRGGSCFPTLRNGDRVISWRILRAGAIKRHDLVLVCLTRQRPELLIKRVIGLPGESVRIAADGHAFINGRLLDEPYLLNGTEASEGPGYEQMSAVPAKHYFLLGDNRSHSADSRNLGPVPARLVLAKALVVLERHSRARTLRTRLDKL